MIKKKDEEEITAESVGIKLDSKKSMFSKKEPRPVNFDDQAKEVHSAAEDKKMRGFDLSQKFLGIFQSKVLLVNKGPIEKANEKEVINKLIAFAIELNNDQAEKEGIGSVGLITLVFNCLLKMRDNMNATEHRLSNIEKLLAQSQAKNEPE